MKPATFRRGDIVVADLGMVAKVRPCLVLAVQPDSEREMAVMAPITTAIRGGECEIPIPECEFLSEKSVVNLVGIFGCEHHKILKRVAPFPGSMSHVEQTLKHMLELDDPGS